MGRGLWGGGEVQASGQQQGWGNMRSPIPEADDSSVFVVGTVLYRNLGSFLALQRWVTWEGDSLTSYRWPVRDW